MADGAAPAPLRVLRILSRLNYGGPSHHVLALSQGLESRGFKTVLAVGAPHSCEGNMIPQALEAGIDARIIPGLDRPIRVGNDTRAFLNIWNLIREFRPHIVHTHTSKAGILGRLAAWANQVPLILHTYHGHVFSGYFSPATSKFIIALERFLASRTSALITLSPQLRVDLLRYLRLSQPAKVRVIPLGLSLERFLQTPRSTGFFRKEFQIPREAFLLGMIGRLVPIKNHQAFLDIFLRLATKYRHLHLAIIGGGETLPILKQRVMELGLSPRVTFTGIFQPLETAYSDLDLLVLPSKSEGTPVVLLEALAGGCPVSATDVGGVRDVLANGKYGTILSQIPSRMESQLDDLIKAQPPIVSLSPDIRRKIVNQYSIPSLVSATSRLYSELIARKALHVSHCSRLATDSQGEPSHARFV